MALFSFGHKQNGAPVAWRMPVLGDVIIISVVSLYDNPDGVLYLLFGTRT